MSTPADPVAALLRALDALPPVAAVTYRGCPAGTAVPVAVHITSGFTATSRDPGVVRGASDELFAVVGRTGRAVDALSAQPHEREVVLLPGIALAPLGVVLVGDVPVHLLEELVVTDVAAADPAALPGSLEDLVARVRADLAGAGERRGPAGKYAGPLA